MSSTHVRAVVAGETYGLPIEHVTEVAELGEVTPLPGAPSVIMGVRNLRGSVVPVASLAVLLGLSGDHSPQRLIVTEDDGRRLALAVEDVTDVTDIDAEPEPSESPLLHGAVLVDGVLIGLLDIRALMSAASPRGR
ncbi:MAG TPA: chemotaxis protein CheW [Solirubrobacteraceae bacterium]|jgi:purine-binding chemotaxis protein CheW|nr:chemotaxis protein CheW [Solirubrobacteraceae bacterium]